DAGYGRDADARKLDDVDDVDADARTDMAPSRCIVSRNVGRDDSSDDAAILGADVVALSRGHRQHRQDAAWLAHPARGHRVLLRLGLVRNSRLSAGRRTRSARDAAPGAG